MIIFCCVFAVTDNTVKFKGADVNKFQKRYVQALFLRVITVHLCLTSSSNQKASGKHPQMKV